MTSRNYVRMSPNKLLFKSKKTKELNQINMQSMSEDKNKYKFIYISMTLCILVKEMFPFVEMAAV